jgi:acetylglutamate kinase
MEEKAHSDSILADIAFMECVGMLPVVVHGGGKVISRRMSQSNLRAKFVKGLRVTDEATMRIVEDVIRNEVNPEIVEALKGHGARAESLDGRNVFNVVKRTEVDEKSGETLEWGFVGEIEAVDTASVLSVLRRSVIPVITPLGKGRDGHTYNLNADDAAAALAKAMKARKLAFLSDVPGLLRDRNDPDSILSTLRVEQVEGLIETGVIDGGMLPKIRSAVEAIQAGVKKVHIIDGRMPHSLLLEIFTNKGVGTEIVRDE